MAEGVWRSLRDYTLAFKLAVFEQVEKGEMSCKEAQARYGIQGQRWCGCASMVGRTGAWGINPYLEEPLRD